MRGSGHPAGSSELVQNQPVKPIRKRAGFGKLNPAIGADRAVLHHCGPSRQVGGCLEVIRVTRGDGKLQLEGGVHAWGIGKQNAGNNVGNLIGWGSFQPLRVKGGDDEVVSQPRLEIGNSDCGVGAGVDVIGMGAADRAVIKTVARNAQIGIGIPG